MYEYDNQQSMFDGPEYFKGATLNPNNRWVLLSTLLPWADIEEKYAEAFSNKREGRPAKSARMAFASELIKKKLCLSDAELVEMITENPYLQYFIGMDEFSMDPPFDSSTLTYFRKRMTAEMLSEINEHAIETHKKRSNADTSKNDGDGNDSNDNSSNDSDNNDDDDSDNNNNDSDSSTNSNDVIENEAGEDAAEEEPENKGTMVLDATCFPQYIRFPTDVSLLNEARKISESLIDTIYVLGGRLGEKPRTYRKRAKKQFNEFTRSRKPRKKTIRKAVKQQLGYLKRNLGHLEGMDITLLSERQLMYYLVIKKLYEQQQQMYDEKSHTVADRIVSIHQDHVRPMVRGKANAQVEFGSKVATSVVDGFSRIENLSWDAYNESTTLQDSCEKYKKREGVYPERILADKIYRTSANRRYCKDNGIAMSGPALGRPPNDKKLYRAQCKKEQEEAGERNCVEGSYGTAKTTYGLDNVMMKLKHTSEVDIYAGILSMNLWKMVKELQASLRQFIFGYIRGMIKLFMRRGLYIQ